MINKEEVNIRPNKKNGNYPGINVALTSAKLINVRKMWMLFLGRNNAISYNVTCFGRVAFSRSVTL